MSCCMANSQSLELLQSELARAAAHAAGRYGHVMFPENVHEPALQCAELLLQGVGRGNYFHCPLMSFS